MAHNRFRRGAVHLLTAAFLVSTLTACHTVPRPLFANDKTTEASPLGPSYVLLPLPGDDDGLLGGHMDVDTTDSISDWYSGDTNAHIHEYDDRHGVGDSGRMGYGPRLAEVAIGPDHVLVGSGLDLELGG